MADFILQTIGGSLTGTSGADNMTFGVQVVSGVPFVATGSLSGGAGNDGFFTLDPRAFFNGIQYAYGNEGNDNITLSGLFTAYGGKDDDIIREIPIIGGAAPVAAQQIFGNEGKDIIDAGGGNDYIEGNQGDDTIDAGDGNDFVYGGKENDFIFGGDGFDTLYGNEGNDTIDGEGDGDLIWGGQGNDSIFGGGGSDTIYGNENNDFINGGADSDSLQGGKGNDTIVGGGSPLGGMPGDTIIGAEGQDRLTGNDGPNNLLTGTVTSNAQYDDIFRYDYGPSANVGVANVDYITNFQSKLGAAANQLTDKLSFAVGADAVLAGLNFNTGTTYDVNRAVGGVADPLSTPINLTATIGASATTYDGVYSAINNYFSLLGINDSPVASTDNRLQVWNFTINTSGTAIPSAGAGTRFLFVNNGDNAVTQADILTQGVTVIDGFNTVTGVAPVSDIIFA